MIVSPTNRESLILQNIIDTLSQVRVGGVAMAPLVLPAIGATITISFYVDAARTTLLFTDTLSGEPDKFTNIGNKIIYTPTDETINFTEDALSALYCLPTYFVRATIDSIPYDIIYNNRQNLLFKSVIVSTQKEPKFTMSEDQAIIVPVSDDELPYHYNLHSLVILSFDIYLQMVAPNLTNLSEKARIDTAYLATNILRTALYKDANRAGNCTFYDETLDGTTVDKCTPLPSEGMFFRGACRVRCCFMASATTF